MMNLQVIITKYGNSNTFKTLPLHNLPWCVQDVECAYYSYYPVDKLTFTRTYEEQKAFLLPLPIQSKQEWS